MSDMVRSFDVVRVRGGRRGADVDRAATEEPLEIRLHGRPFAVVMRTPGADRELAAGFLLAEQVISGSDDLGTIEYCTERPPVARPTLQENIVNVTLMDQARVERALADRRQVTTNSSCGMCGRRTIESLTADVAPVASTWTMPAPILLRLPERLRAAQAGFDETGGLHAAGLFTPDGQLADHAEDVGRHNAVDKVKGEALRRGIATEDLILLSTGRVSSEMLLKAARMGVPVVASRTSPTEMAVALAEQLNVTVCGYVRPDSLNVYAGEAILLPEETAAPRE